MDWQVWVWAAGATAILVTGVAYVRSTPELDKGEFNYGTHAAGERIVGWLLCALLWPLVLMFLVCAGIIWLVLQGAQRLAGR